MTIGSAASSMEAPVFSFRRDSEEWPAAEAPGRLYPRPALADEPPRGRILIATDHAPLALEVQRILRAAGYRAVGPAATPEDAERLMGPRPVDGAVVDLQIHGGGSMRALLEQEGIPFVGISPGTSLAPLAARALGWPYLVTEPVQARALMNAIERAISSRPAAREIAAVPPPQAVWPRVFPQL